MKYMTVQSMLKEMQVGISEMKSDDFGVTQIVDPQQYRMINSGVLYCFDLLWCIKEKFGKSCASHRDIWVTLFSGYATDDYVQRKLVYLYQRHASFANYIDLVYLYNKSEKSLAHDIFMPFIEEITAELDSIMTQCNRYGIKIISCKDMYLWGHHRRGYDLSLVGVKSYVK